MTMFFQVSKRQTQNYDIENFLRIDPLPKHVFFIAQDFFLGRKIWDKALPEIFGKDFPLFFRLRFLVRIFLCFQGFSLVFLPPYEKPQAKVQGESSTKISVKKQRKILTKNQEKKTKEILIKKSLGMFCPRSLPEEKNILCKKKVKCVCKKIFFRFC